MPTDDPIDSGRFLSHVEACEREDDLFHGLYQDTDPEACSVAELRRHRRRAANEVESTMKAISLVEEDGTLYWRDGVPARLWARTDASQRGGPCVGSATNKRVPQKILAKAF